MDELSCELALSFDIPESWVFTVEVEEIGRVAVDETGRVDCEVEATSLEGAVLGSSNVSFEKSCETEVEGATAGSCLYEEGAGMVNSTRASFWLSLMEMTIFSRSTGVMCFSQGRLLLSVERWRVSSGRAVAASSSSSDTADSRLEDNSGTGMSLVAACGFAGFEKGVEGGEGGEQQKVSRFQSRQLRFSRRFPSSMACEVLEKSDHCEGEEVSGTCCGREGVMMSVGAGKERAYHAKEVLDAARVDCVQRGHFNPQQRVLGRKGHDGGDCEWRLGGRGRRE